MDADVIVVGAGVAGLQCARRLVREGRRVVVLDRARGVGGRCATRRMDGQPVDFGPLFLHGHQPAFLAAVDEVEDVNRLEGWPERIRGSGKPCQPDAFAPDERRLAFAEGLAAFPRHLARGLDVRLRTNVNGLAGTDLGWTVHVEDGDPLTARDVVLALALEQSMALLDGLPGEGELGTAQALMELFLSLPCLVVIALYGEGATAPEFDVWYPSRSDVLTLIGHDSAKRDRPRRLALVLQAEPRWSRERMDHDPERWSRELLDTAGFLLGDWAASPDRLSVHRWRYARVDRGNELTSPLLVRRDDGARLGLAGDVFAPNGGVQASWLSGDRLATRLTDEE